MAKIIKALAKSGIETWSTRGEYHESPTELNLTIKISIIQQQFSMTAVTKESNSRKI